MIHVEMIWVECLDRRKLHNRVSFSLCLVQNPLSFSLPLTSIPLFTIRTIHVIQWVFPHSPQNHLAILCVSHTDFSVRHADTSFPPSLPLFNSGYLNSWGESKLLLSSFSNWESQGISAVMVIWPNPQLIATRIGSVHCITLIQPISCERLTEVLGRPNFCLCTWSHYASRDLPETY